MNDVFIFGTNPTFDFLNLFSLIVTAFIGIITIWLMWSIFKKERYERKKERYDLQISLLHSLLVELNQISSPSNDIYINGKTYKHKGNLEWYEEDILPKYKKKMGNPPHEVWRINTQEYLAKLRNELNNKDLVELKKLLVLINQKLELIRNYFIGGIDAKDIEKVISETKEMVSDAKNFLGKGFNIT